LKEVLIGISALIFGWALVFFFTGGAIGLSIVTALMYLFPVLIKPIIIIGSIFGIIFILGRLSK
jgi:hypothetical protein